MEAVSLLLQQRSQPVRPSPRHHLPPRLFEFILRLAFEIEVAGNFCFLPRFPTLNCPLDDFG